MTTRQVKRLDHYNANDMRQASVEARHRQDIAALRAAIEELLKRCLEQADNGQLTATITGMRVYVEAFINEPLNSYTPRTQAILARLVTDMRETRNFVVTPLFSTTDDSITLKWGEGETP